MEEELLLIIEQMEAAGESPEEIAKVVDVYTSQQPVEEKKNPNQSEPSGELVDETGASDSSETQMEVDGSSDLPDTEELVPKGTSGIDKYILVRPEQGKEKEEKQDFYKESFMSGMSRMNEMISSIPESIYALGAVPQNLIADAFGIESLKASPEKFKEVTGISNPILDHYKEETAKIKEKTETYKEENYETSSISESIGNGNYDEAFELLGAGILENAPTSVAMMASGATLGIGRAAAVNTTALLNQEREQLRDDNPDMSETELFVKSLASAGAESVFAAIGTGTIGSVYKDLLKKEGVETGTKIFKDGLIETYKRALKKFGAPVGALGEGIEESVTQITQNMIAGKPVMEGVADAFILGVGSGGVMTAPITGANVLETGGKTKLDIPAESDVFDKEGIPFNANTKQKKALKSLQEANPELKTIQYDNEIVSLYEEYKTEAEPLLDKAEAGEKLTSAERRKGQEFGNKVITVSKQKGIDIEKAFNYMDVLKEATEKTPAPVKSKAGKSLFTDVKNDIPQIVEEFKTKKGIQTPSGQKITEIDPEVSKTIADEYEKMEHNPNDPEVKEAYTAMVDETIEQFEALKKAGYTVEIYEGKGEPYANSQEMLKDLSENKHLYVLSTENEYGQEGITDEQRSENPLLAKTDFNDKNGKPLLANDVFRFVHDAIGHGERGNSFGPIGEENAWDVHARMYSDKARRAMTTETKGQNSWVNFNAANRNEDGSIKKKGDKGYIPPQKRPFAEQKLGLLPQWVSDIQDVTIDESGVNETDPTNDADTQTTAQGILDSINEGRKNNLSNEEIIENFENKDDKAAAEVFFQREADQKMTEQQAMEKSKELAEKSRKQQNKGGTKYVSAKAKAINSILDYVSDRQASVKRILVKAGFESTIDYMVARLGASAYAKHQSDKAHRRTFDRLSQKDAKTLEEIIVLRRIIAIDKNRSDRKLPPVKHQGNLTSVSAQKALDGYKKALGTEKYNDIVNRADSYFDEYRNLLKTMKEEGLITKDTYEIFAEIDYQPRVFLDFLEDMEGNFLNEELDNFETSSLSKDQIKSLRGGSTGSQSMDAQRLLQRSIMARAKAVFANRMNSAFAAELTVALDRLAELEAKEGELTKSEKKQLTYLKELNSKVRPDRIIGFNKSGKPKYALAKGNTQGYKAIYYYKDGVAHRIWMSNEFHTKFTDTSNQILTATSREVISKGSGTRLVKSLATGNNPLFLITNVPRDLAFALAFSKEYGAGYKTFVPVELVKLLKDFGKGAGQALAKGSLYDKYIEYGGGMDFLTIQGRYGNEGIFSRYAETKIAEKFTDFGEKGGGRRAKDFMTWLKKINTASEFATRIGVFDRSIANQLKAKGIKDINSLSKPEQDKIYTKAIRSARELTDFNQGGKFTKALDSAVPYLNAATQGTRSAGQNLIDRPLETTSRILQIAGGFTALTVVSAFGLIGANRDDEDEEISKMTNQEIYFETLRAVSPYDLRNYYIFPLGKKDAKGNWRYGRIAKAQALSPLVNTAEHYLRKYYSEVHGIEYKQDLGNELYETISLNILPLEINPMDAITRVPLVDAAFAWNGIDSYTGNPLDWKRGKIPAELEGIVDDRVESFYKEIGAVTGFSPIRLKSATESFITTPSTNPFVGFGYLGAEYIAAGEKKDLVDNFFNAASKRVVKSTSEYNVISKALSRVNDDVVEAYAKHITIEKAVRDAVRKTKQEDDVAPLEERLGKVFKDNPEMAEKAISWAKSELKKKKLNPFVSSLRFETNKDVRAILIAERYGDALLRSEAHYSDKEKKVVKELVEEKVLDKETYAKYKKLVE